MGVRQTNSVSGLLQDLLTGNDPLGLERQDKWDRRFMEVARVVASWSKDPSTKCGCVIVRPDLTIASTGFNGFPKGCSDADELYENRDEKLARVIHSELNGILHAKEPLEGYTLYVTPIPTCDRCAAHIIQSGITTVVYENNKPKSVARWADAWERAQELYEEAGVQTYELKPKSLAEDLPGNY